MSAAAAAAVSLCHSSSQPSWLVSRFWIKTQYNYYSVYYIFIYILTGKNIPLFVWFPWISAADSGSIDHMNDSLNTVKSVKWYTGTYIQAVEIVYIYLERYQPMYHIGLSVSPISVSLSPPQKSCIAEAASPRSLEMCPFPTEKRRCWSID